VTYASKADRHRADRHTSLHAEWRVFDGNTTFWPSPIPIEQKVKLR
jgi:hypothetical protein